MYPGRSRISDILCFIRITWHNGPFIQSMPGISVLTARVMYIITVLFCPTYLRHSTRFPAHISQ
ncbi:hypothetical protein BCR43DRAFT_493590 [Syncephalastrum racemosum]|uniref:Uncharacterized protein n=1 Tax=Syncephalastrum racemosum TaxID=13706 RepID=A0A1X2HAT3_SYNRA|nr:hypothetical protein BCR43DRAFT_493590 [Syncephalastrum racemosum]